MWYVMQVMTGQESQTVLMLERSLPEGVLEKCFVPMRRRKKKYQGKWHEVVEKLFPGYVFLVSDYPQLLYDELKNIPAMTRLLGSCEEYFTPLSEEDVYILLKLQKNVCKPQTHQGMWRNRLERGGGQEKFGIMKVDISRIRVGEKGLIRIVSGPLKNLEGQIRKINLHKRIAVVEAEFMGNKSQIHLGIEIIEGNENG
jgi:transcriptional antiterminator NusG